jgi:hypothetical protein
MMGWRVTSTFVTYLLTTGEGEGSHGEAVCGG